MPTLVPQHRRTARFVALEQLEQRTLMAFSVADYLPMSTGNAWSYTGTSGGRTATMSMTSASGFTESGINTTRFRFVDNDPSGTVIESRYLSVDSSGLRWHRRDRTEGSNTQVDRLPGGLSLLPAVFDVGQTYSHSAQYSSSDGSRTAGGNVSGAVTVFDEENVSTPAGVFRALRVHQVDQGRLTLTSGGSGYVDYELEETQWWAKGIGIVKLVYALDQRFSDGSSSPESLSISLTSSSLSNRIGFQLFGNGVEIQRNDSTPSATDNTTFGNVRVTSGAATRSFLIRNDSQSTMTIGSPSIGGNNASEFAIIAQPRTTLSPGASSTFTVRFDPSAVGTRFARITITSSDPTSSPFTFRVRGTGTTAPSIGVRGANAQTPIQNGSNAASFPTGTRFGQTTAAGSSAIERSFLITNSGTGSLSLLGSPRVRVRGAAASDFVVTVQPSQSVSGNGSTTFIIRFNPSASGGRRAVVEIQSNDPSKPVFTFVIAGTGI